MRKIRLIALLFTLSLCGFLSNPSRGEVVVVMCGLNPDITSITLTSTDVLCNLDTNGNAKVVVIGNGAAEPYTYNWSCVGCSGQGTDSIYNLASGFYSVTVTASMGAPCLGTVEVNDQPPLTCSFSPTSDTLDCAGDADGNIIVLVGGGVPFGGGTYQYSWDNGETSFNAVALDGGTHQVVFNDSNMCFDSCQVIIVPPLALLANVTGTDITCGGANDGTVLASPTGGTGAYTYSWDSGPTPTSASQSGLSVGAYCVTVTDENGCTANACYTVLDATPIALTMDSTNESCGGSCDGKAWVIPSGGVLPYTYIWDDPLTQTTDTAFGLCAGTYCVTVTDNNGCTGSGCVVIGSPPSLTLTLDSTEVLCFGNSTGTGIAIAGGGTPFTVGVPYQYQWDAAAANQITATATGLGVGCYDVTVTDSLGCMITGNICVTDYPLLTVGIDITDLTCSGVCDGTATATAGGGNPIPAYTYSWNSSPVQTTSTATGLCADTFNVTVIDGNGCTVTSADSIIAEPPPLTTSMSKTEETCTGATDGTATVTAGGGTLPYAYIWSNGDNGATADSLSCGKVFVTVTDFSGCSAIDSIDLICPTPLTLTLDSTAATCGGVCDGISEAFPLGGNPPYSYAWSASASSQTTKIATALCAGTHSVTVTDNSGCTVIDSMIIDQPIVLTLTMDSTLITCNGAGDGTGTANPGGGTGPGTYTYLWNTVPAQTTQTAVILISGTWCVTVTDGTGCQITGCINQVDPPALTLTTSHTDISCNGDCDGTATATAGGGTGGYIYAWGDGQTSSVATALCAGAIGVTVTDANGCTITGSETIVEPSGITPNVTTTSSTCGNPDGSACVAPTGGTPNTFPPYSIEWFTVGPPTVFANCLPAVVAGTYLVEIIDSNFCRDTATAFVSDIASHTVVMSDTDITCAGADDGIGLGLATGGTPPYTYQWLTIVGDTIIGETDSVIFGLQPGSYVLQIDDALGCTIFDSVSISEPTPLLANLSSVDVLCSGDCNGSVTTAPSGGIPPYTILWGTGEDSLTLTGRCPGFYPITLTDANGCVVIDSVQIQSQALLSLNRDTVHILCNGDATGQGIATPVGGVGPYVYIWNTAPVQTDSIATGLTAGTYCVTLTDANLCQDTACVTVLEPPVLTIIMSKTDVTCFGACDGTGTATVGGGTGAGTYGYSWDDPGTQTTATATGLCAGTFGVTVTDGNGCTINGSVTITQPTELTVVMSVVSNVSCNGLTDGSATATPSGGPSGTYVFSWSNGDVTTLADPLAAGWYYVTITDGPCSVNDSIEITEPAVLAVTKDSVDVDCNGNCDGIANVHTTGGTTTYTFLWDAGAGNQTDSTATGLCAGTYSVTVSDANTCSLTTTVTINEPLPLAANFSTVDATCNVCDGQASSAPSGGFPPYVFNWLNPFSASDPTNDTIFNQCAGFRDLQITDDSSCTVTFTVGVNNFGAPIIDSIDSTGVTCFGDCDGVAVVHVQPLTGTPPYTIAWNDPAPVQTDTIADSLCAGPISVQVEDAIGCIVVGSTTITTPTEILSLISGVNVLCFGNNTGQAQTAPSGGTPPYTHLWTPGGATTDTIFNLIAGTYIDTITDATGCFIVDTIVITEPPALNVTVFDSTNISCAGVCDGIIRATTTGGTPLYTYNWSSNPFQTDSVDTAICAGVADTAIVTDGNGCRDTIIVTLSEPVALTANITDSTNVSCFGQCFGTATVTPFGGTAPYLYLWDNLPGFDTDSMADSLCSDTVYTVTITDANLCTVQDSVVLSQPALLTATITDSTNVSCNGVCDGTATVTAGGGTGIYTFLWDDPAAQVNDTATALCADSLYHILVTDSFGCTAMDSVTLSAPLALNLSISDSTNISCFGLSDGSAVGLATGGSTPYVYIWYPSGTVNDTVIGLSAGGIDTLVVVDSNACSDTVMVTLSEPGVLSVSIVDSVNASCFGTCDGIARTATAGGTAPFSYSWSLSSDTLDSAIALCADTMNVVTVTDTNGCIATDSVTLSQPLEIFAIITDSTDATCYGVCDGQAVMFGFGGTAPITYAWCNGETGDSAFALCADSINCGVAIDSLGCTDTAFFSISSPPEIVIVFTDSSAALCDGGCEGNATAAVSGGTPALTISWSNGDTSLMADSLCAGTWVLTVTDDLGCFNSDSITIVSPTAFVVDTVSTTSAACDSTCDAMAVVFGTGGNTPYTFAWNDSASTANDTVLNLCASTYIVTATDSNGCVAMDTIVIFGPDSLSSTIVASSMITCTGGCDGSATASGSGGVGAYTYTWVDTAGVVYAGPGLNDTTITGLCPGLYYAVVKDANGCITTAPITITEPDTLMANVCDTNNVTCFLVCDGSATSCAQGGTRPYNYLWDDPAVQTDSMATGLCADTFSITVTDANGCTAIETLIVIEEPTLLSCSFDSIFGTGCGSDSATGRATVLGNGGTPPYQYLWDILPIGSETDTIADSLLAGTYNVTVTDNNGCETFCNTAITDSSDMAAAMTDSGMVSCFGVCDGFATVTTTGSTQPYTYEWFDSLNISIGDIDSTGNNLCVGIHRVIVGSAAACYRSIPIQITEPDSLDAFISDTLSPLCNADSNGRLVAAPTGGTPPYTFAWYDTSSVPVLMGITDTLDSLPAGQYWLFVSDSNGCQDSSLVTVTEPNLLMVAGIDTIQPACSNTCDGQIAVAGTGGTTPYAYLWSDVDSTANDTLFNACVDTFVITVTDTNGCFASDTIVLAPVIAIVADAGPDQQICELDTLTLIADTLGSTFQWYMDSIVLGDILGSNDTLTTTPTLTGLHTYILIVGDSICSDTDSVAVFIVPVAVDACCDVTIAKGECVDLIATVTNGLTYSWSPGISLNDSVLSNPEACPGENTTYTLTAVNDSGCAGTDTVQILVNPDIPDGFTPQGDGYNDVWEIALLTNFPDAEVQVYNRWGQMVFDSPKGEMYATKFDGTYDGKDLPVGTYYFVINLNDGVTDPITGPLTIMR